MNTYVRVFANEKKKYMKVEIYQKQFSNTFNFVVVVGPVGRCHCQYAFLSLAVQILMNVKMRWKKNTFKYRKLIKNVKNGFIK